MAFCVGNTFTLNGIDSTSFGAYTSGGTTARVYEIATPYAAEDLFRIYYAQTADAMTLCHPNYAPRELTRTGHTSWTLSLIAFQPTVDEPTGMSVVATVGTGSTTYKYRVTAVIEANYEESLTGFAPTKAVTGATKANPCQITATAHGYTSGDSVRLKSIGGMTDLNDKT